MQESSLLAEEQLASELELCFVELQQLRGGVAATGGGGRSAA